MPYEYPVKADGTGPLGTPSETAYHVQEALDAACHAIRVSRRREEFAALLDLILAAKNAEEAVERG